MFTPRAGVSICPVGGMELHKWVFPLKEFREMHGEQGG
jgi:hypothetical protein